MELQDRMIMSMIQGFSTAYVLYTACELEVFDYLDCERQMTLANLSEALTIEEEILYRLLRPLIALQLIQVEQGVFSLTSLGKRLSKYAAQSLQGLVLFCGREGMPAWAKMYEAVKLHKLPYLLVDKKSIFAVHQEDTGKFSSFNRMMQIANAHLDLSPYFRQQTSSNKALTIMDIGGGTGDIIAKFLEFYPNAAGIILDLEHVADEARRNLTVHKVNERCAFTSGDFFRPLETQADLFILSRILHDWEDAKACKILKNVGAAMTEDATLLVIEKMLPQAVARDDLPLYLHDLYIWSMCGGKERTEAEFEKIFRDSGLVLKKKYKLAADEYVLEVARGYEEGIM